MLEKGITAIDVRALVFGYQEQKGWVRLAGKNSGEFSLTNETRQGSVLSSCLFSAYYIDDLLRELRQKDLGCHIAGVWLSACAFAVDLAVFWLLIEMFYRE